MEMTREEAKNYIGELKMYAKSQGWDEEYQVACDMAMNDMEQEPCEDCISRQAVINEMEKRHAEGDCITKGFIKNLSSVTPQPRWIPVSERLPDIHNYTEKYLVTLERGWVHTAMCTQCDGKHWWTYDDVVAWMPLPQPYEPKESEGEI